MPFSRLFVLLAALPLSACQGALRAAPSPVPLDALRGERALRLMTFNIQRAKRGVDGVAAEIEKAQPHLVALQEVDAGTRRSGGADQAAELARRTGFSYHAFFPAMERDGGQYGVALLSRYPILAQRTAPLPNRPGVEPRAVGRALVSYEGSVMSVYVTHLAHLPHLGTLRVEQMRKILRLMAADPRPKVLMGDLNDTQGSRAVRLASQALRNVFAAAGRGPSGTFPLPLLFLPDPTFDYVLVSRELTPKAAYVQRSSASDHYPVVTEVYVPAPGSQTASTASASR